MTARKTKLLIMRHAKSDKSIFELNDFDRPLNERGMHQPQKIAQHLNELGIEIDAALVSPALRTVQTFEILTEELPNPPTPILDERLYNASLEELIDVLSLYIKEGTLLVVGHNPSLSHLLSILSARSYDMGTSELAILETNLLHPSFNERDFELKKILKP